MDAAVVITIAVVLIILGLMAVTRWIVPKALAE